LAVTDDFWDLNSAAHMTLLEMLKREQPMAASYSWLRNDCGMPATATIIKSVPDIIAALEAAEKMAVAAIAAMPGGGPGAWVPADHLAEANREIARMREVLGMIEAIGDGSKTANSLTNIADIARAAIKDTQP
jgi:hypothetical protein